MPFNIKKVPKLVLFFILSFIFLCVFSYGTSPLMKHYHGADCSFFLMIGKSLKHGLLLYRDVFDQKGPLFFLIEWFGQVISEGKTGAFILQCINLSTTMYIADEILLLANKKFKTIIRILFQLLLAWILTITLQEGNLTEEFVQPFLFYSLFLIIKYFKNLNNEIKHNPWYAFVYGVFFCCIALAKITNAAFVCSCVLTITIILLINKEYKNLLDNILFFVLGIAVVFGLTSIYFLIKGTFSDMIFATFIYPFSYATYMSTEERLSYIFSTRNISLYLMCIIPLLVCIIFKIKKYYYILLSILSIIFTTFVTTLGFCYAHYFSLTLPVVWLGIYLVIDSWDVSPVKKIIILIYVLCIMAMQISYVQYSLKQSYKKILDFNNVYEEETKLDEEIGNYIPDNEKDQVWGYIIDSKFYLRTNTYPCIKHFDYLDNRLYLDEQNNLIRMLNESSPKWLVISKNKGEIPSYVSDLFVKYQLFAENEAYYLYCLN